MVKFLFLYGEWKFMKIGNRWKKGIVEWVIHDKKVLVRLQIFRLELLRHGYKYGRDVDHCFLIEPNKSTFNQWSSH